MRKVIIDTDMGSDDALALILALNSLEFDIIGIIGSYGNTSNINSYNNINFILEKYNKNIAVYLGSSKPLNKEYIIDNNYCGKDGLCDYLNRELSYKINDNYLEFLRDSITNNENITILGLAPFTSIARLILEYPYIDYSKVDLVCCGGNFRMSNIKRDEWNYSVDKEASNIVFNSKMHKVCLGLEVTGLLNNNIIEILKNDFINNFSSELFNHFIKYNSKHNLNDYALLVDSLVVYYLINKNSFSGISGTINNDNDIKLVEGGNDIVVLDYDENAFIEVLRRRLISF